MIVIGKIIKPQGIRGEVKVLPLSDASWFDGLTAAYINDKKYDIASLQRRGSYVYILFEVIRDRNTAEEYRNQEICIRKEQQPPLPEGRYLISDFIGIRLFDQAGAEIGTVTAVDQFGAADVVTVQTEKGTLRFPFINQLQLKADIGNRRGVLDGERLREVAVYEDGYED